MSFVTTENILPQAENNFSLQLAGLTSVPLCPKEHPHLSDSQAH
jgi:hypothetical protein